MKFCMKTEEHTSLPMFFDFGTLVTIPFKPGNAIPSVNLDNLHTKL